jgi:hypothetical protein
MATSALFDKFKKKAEVFNNNDSTSSSNDDPRLWKPSYDKVQGGTCRIRLLWNEDIDESPFVQVFSHGFVGNTGKWYIENSLSTLKQKDPVGEMNGRLWNSGVDSDKDVARSHKRRTNLYVNVLVVDDPQDPTNNGMVKIMRYGPQIQGIVTLALFPEFETDTALEVFATKEEEGIDFEIRTIMKKLGKDLVPNYERSKFMEPSPLLNRMEVLESCHELAPFEAPDKFKSYDELRNRLYEVLGSHVGSGIETVVGFEAPSESAAAPRTNSVLRNDTPPQKEATQKEAPEPTGESASASSDDDMDFFKNL